MPTTTRSANLDLLRHLNFGHKNTAKKLSSLTNENYISQMVTGDREISDHDARSIERLLSLPTGWMDRDNLAMLRLDRVDFDLCASLTRHSQPAKEALLTLLSAIASK